jgi:hypothetical protein
MVRPLCFYAWLVVVTAHMHLGIWNKDFVPSDFGGWTNYAITTNLTACAESKRTYGLSCLFDLHWHLYTDNGRCTTRSGKKKAMVHLKPKIQAVWEQIAVEYELEGMFQNGTIIG